MIGSGVTVANVGALLQVADGVIIGSSLKYDGVYLSEYGTGSEARAGISWWMDFYDQRRPHSSLDDLTPNEAYSDEGTARRPGLCPASSQPKVA